MSLRVLTSLFSGICLLVVLATTPVAQAYVQGSDALVGNNSDGNASAKPRASMGSWDKARIYPAERAWQNPTPGNEPAGDDASAPIPEPGTLTLASLGLLALGSALRKRRGAQAPNSAGIR